MIGEFVGSFRGPSRRELETAYLNESVSIVDLERRMSEIDRGKFRYF
ncbi:MAG: DUF3563 family protein [Rhizobiaceae bacterium]